MQAHGVLQERHPALHRKQQYDSNSTKRDGLNRKYASDLVTGTSDERPNTYSKALDRCTVRATAVTHLVHIHDTRQWFFNNKSKVSNACPSGNMAAWSAPEQNLNLPETPATTVIWTTTRQQNQDRTHKTRPDSRSGEGVDPQVSLFRGILRRRAGAPGRKAKTNTPRNDTRRNHNRQGLG